MLSRKSWLHTIALGGVMILMLAAMGACAGGDEDAPGTSGSAPAVAAPSDSTGTETAAASTPLAAEQFKLFPDDGMPQYGGTLNLAHLDGPTTLSHIDHTTTYSMIAVNGIYETLVNLEWRADPVTYTAAVTEGLAKSWDVSADGTVWTFILQDDAKWHDGTPVTSADVKATYEHMVNPGEATPPGRSYTRPFIDSIETPDAKTVVLNLKAPNPVLLNNLAVHWTMIVPKSGLDQGYDWFKTNVMGSGPFKWVPDKWERGISYQWVRNDDYRDEGVPYLDAKKTFVMQDRGAQLAAFETKKIDDTWQASPSQAQDLLKKYGEELNLVKVTGGFPHIQINTLRPPFDNPNVRKALYLWWDRQEFLDKVHNGAGRLIEWINPIYFKAPGGGGYGTSPEALVRDNLAWRLDKTEARLRAKEILAEEGLTDLSKITVDVVIAGTSGTDFRAGQVLAAQLRELGFDAKLQAMERVAGFQAHQKGEYDILSRGGVAPFPAPDGMLNRYVGPGGTRNYTNVEDLVYDAKLDELNATVDPAKRAQIIAWFDEYLQQGTYPSQILYWFDFNIVRWNYNKGRKYLQPAGHMPDDHSWLAANAPGRK
jgi:peptide/nickel transport system substrate-binding protein